MTRSPEAVPRSDIATSADDAVASEFLRAEFEEIFQLDMTDEEIEAAIAERAAREDDVLL